MKAKDKDLYNAIKEGGGSARQRAGALIDAGADVKAKPGTQSWSMLHWAAYHGDQELVQLLLTAGVDPNDQENKDGWAPLHVATDAEIITLLAEHGADPNATDKKGNTPIMTALSTANTAATSKSEPSKVINKLIEVGTNVSATKEKGWTALHAAIMMQKPDLARVLVEAGADLTIAHHNYGTPLHHAVTTRQEELVRLLLDADAPVNSNESQGELTPLHYAAMHDSQPIVDMLLSAGADPEAKDKQGKQPIDYAANEEMKEEIRKVMSGKNG